MNTKKGKRMEKKTITKERQTPVMRSKTEKNEENENMGQQLN